MHNDAKVMITHAELARRGHLVTLNLCTQFFDLGRSCYTDERTKERVQIGELEVMHEHLRLESTIPIEMHNKTATTATFTDTRLMDKATDGSIRFIRHILHLHPHIGEGEFAGIDVGCSDFDIELIHPDVHISDSYRYRNGSYRLLRHGIRLLGRETRVTENQAGGSMHMYRVDSDLLRKRHTDNINGRCKDVAQHHIRPGIGCTILSKSQFATVNGIIDP